MPSFAANLTMLFPAFFRDLERIGYDGWVGCEYTPRSCTEAGLVWIKDGTGSRVT